MKYILKKKLGCVKQMQKGTTLVVEVTKNRKILRKTLYRWSSSYKKLGELGLDIPFNTRIEKYKNMF